MANQREREVRGESSSPLVLPAYPRWILFGSIAAIAAVIVVVALIVAPSHEESQIPEDTPAEQQVIAALGVPVETLDDELIGDLLVERYYGIEVSTGERFVADVLKGRISNLFEGATQPEPQYLVNLDRTGLAAEETVYAQLLTTVLPVKDSDGTYLGLKVEQPALDFFMLNYTGQLPANHSPLGLPPELADVLQSRARTTLDATHRGLNIDGTVYYVSDTGSPVAFPRVFETGAAVLVSQAVIVDATSPEQRALLYELRRENPPATATPD